MQVAYVRKGNKQAPLAFIGGDGKSAPEADIAWMDEDGQWHYEKDVARRAPADYDEKGGGDTWHALG